MKGVLTIQYECTYRRGTCLMSTSKGVDTKSVLIIRSTYYQGWFMYMRYTQGQNEEYFLSRSVY